MYIIVTIVAIALLVTLKPSWIGHWKKITDGLTVQYWTMLACILLSSFATKTLVDILRWFFLVTMPSFPILQSLMSLVWILNGVFLFEVSLQIYRHRYGYTIAGAVTGASNWNGNVHTDAGHTGAAYTNSKMPTKNSKILSHFPLGKYLCCVSVYCLMQSCPQM